MSGSTTGLQPDIALGFKPPEQGNPLATIGQYANSANAFNQLKLFPQRQQQLELQNQGQALANQQAELTQHYTRLKAGNGLMLPLLLNPDGTPTTGVSGTDIAKGLADGVNSGILTASDAVQLQSSLPGDGKDPVANRKWLAGHFAANMAASDQIAQAVQLFGPSAATRDTGQEIQSGATAGPLSQNPGGFTQAQGVPTQTYPSRGQLISQVQWQDKGGVTHYGTQAEYAAQEGLGNVLGPAVPVQGNQGTPNPGGTSGAPAGFPKGYTGRLPPAVPAQQMSNIEGPAPGTVEPQQQSGTQYAADQRAAGSFAQRVLPLKQAIGLLSDTQTGPGSETLNQFRSFLVSMANQGLLPKDITPDAIGQAKFDELRKYMSNYITNLPFAAGSDARMAEAVSGNPHASMSTIANQDVARVLVGLERFRQAQYLSFNQEHPNNPTQSAGSYGPYAAKFSTQYDPRAFAYDLMNPEERTKLYNSMNDKEKERYRASLKLAYGLPGLMQ